MVKDVRVLLTTTVLWQLCLGLVPFRHSNRRLFSVSGESSATGATFNLSCLMQECHQTWSHIVQPPTPLTSADHLNTHQRQLGKDDGVVMIVLHGSSGTILLRKTFNTWNTFTYAHDLKWWIKKIRPGSLVVMLVHRVGTYGLGVTIPTLTNLGSILVSYTPSYGLWMWVFVAGGRTILETVAPNNKGLESLQIPSVYAHALVPATPDLPSFASTNIDPLQEQLCNNTAALGPLCDPVEPMVLPPLEKFYSKSNQEFGVIVCAGGRIQYLAHTLIHLLNNKQISHSNILVAVGVNFHTGLPDSNIISLISLFRLRYKVINTSPNAQSTNHRLFQFYRGAWASGTATFPNSRYLAFLDEDVEVSRDWMELLLHYAPALDLDDSLWCVSGISAAHMNIHPDPQLMMRGRRQPGWGFLVQTSEAKSAVAKWPDTSSVSILYDTFLYYTVGRDRECLYPALSRSKHYGVGVNTVPEMHHYYFLERPLHNGSPVLLPAVSTVTKEIYESRIRSRLSQASPITRNPCAPGFVIAPKPHEPKDLVFYFYLDNLENSLEWTLLAECVGAWPYSTQGMHRGSVELPQSWGGSIWLIGVPASPYGSYKPSHIPVWQPTTEEAFEEQMNFMASLRLPPDLTNRTLQVAATRLFITKH